MPATLNPARFVKEILKPGIYFKNGKRIIVTADDVAQRRDSLQALHAAGLRAPVIYEHLEIEDDQVEGVPAEPQELDQHEIMRLTVGKTVADDARSLRINEEGGLDVVIEVGDANAAAQLASGAIQFVSPELRPFWEHKKTGKKFPHMVSHIALTHDPIQIDQRPGFAQLSATPMERLSGIVQLSGADLISSKAPKMAKTKTPPVRKPGKLTPTDVQFLRTIAVQLAGSRFDDDDDDRNRRPLEDERPTGSERESRADTGEGSGMPPIPQSPPSNPDMPAGPDSGEMQLEALLAHANRRGIVLPSDTTLENLVERLLTAFMTLNAADALHDSEDKANDANGDGIPGNSQAKEFSPMNASQFSGGKPVTPPVDDSAARTALVARIKSCKQLPPAMRETLLVNAGAVQFSGGVEKKAAGSLGIGDVLTMFEEQAVQFSAGSPQASLVERIRRLRGTAIPPGIADNLLAKVGSIQFSAEGKEVAAGGVSISSLVAQYEAAGSAAGALFSDQSAAAGYQLSGAIVTPDHPAGEQYKLGKSKELVAGSPDAIQFANAVLERTGHGSPINNDGTPKPAGQRRLAINATEAFRAA